MQTKITAMLAGLLSLTVMLSLLCGCSSSADKPVEESEVPVASEAATEKETPAVNSEGFETEIETSAEAEPTGELTTHEDNLDLSDEGFVWGSMELPIVQESLELTYFFSTQPFMMSYSGTVEYDQLPFFTEMEERTGIHIATTAVSMMNASEQFNLMVASGDYTDLLEGSYTGGAQQGIEDEVIYPLNDLLETDMPNYKMWLDRTEDVRRVVSTDEGYIYKAGYIMCNNPGIVMGPVIRQDWLDEAKLSVPVTYDDIYNALSTFKANGHKEALWMTSALEVFVSAWSAGFDCYNGYLVKNGVIEYSPITDGYLDYVTMLNKWWSEGLIYSDFISVAPEADTIDSGLVLNGSVGVWASDTSTSMIIEENGGFDITPITIPVKTEGQQIHLGVYDEYTKGGTMMSTTCKDKSAAARWMDYQYTYDGYILSNFGIEGETFDFNEDGQAVLYDEIVDNPKFITPVGLVLFTKFGGAGICDCYRNTLGYVDENWEDIAIWNTNRNNDYMLPQDSIFNAEESVAYSNIMSDIETYFQETVLKFVIGELPLSDWDNYVEAVNSMGIVEATEIYQNAYDRYQAR